MDINMSINNNSGKEVIANIHYKKNKKRELLINSFIKKFPKVKLHTIIEVNKYYTNHYEINNCDKKISNENEIINDYLMNY